MGYLGGSGPRTEFSVSDLHREFPLPIVHTIGTAAYIQVLGFDSVCVDIDAAGEGAFMMTYLPTKEYDTYMLKLYFFGIAATATRNFTLAVNRYRAGQNSQGQTPRFTEITLNTTTEYTLDITGNLTAAPYGFPMVCTVGVIYLAAGDGRLATDLGLVGGCIKVS